MKDLLSNVGSGGGAAAPAAGGAAAGGAAAAEEAKEEEKEEGMSSSPVLPNHSGITANRVYREGGVGRGYGFRSLRLDKLQRRQLLPLCTSKPAWPATGVSIERMGGGRKEYLPGCLDGVAFHGILWRYAPESMV